MSLEVNEILHGLDSKFEQLVSLSEKTRVELDKLHIDKLKADKKNAEQSEQIKALEEKHKNLLLTQVFAHTSESNEEAKEKISRIVREIDKCILLLST
jgi:hypothetical protein